MEEIPVKKIVDSELRNLGFKPHANNWYRSCNEQILHVVGLQKSSWGKYYYINLAVSIKALAETEFPKFYQCPLRCRIDSVPDSPPEIESALNEEDYWKMDAVERTELIKLVLCNAEMHFFRKLKTLNDVQIFVQNAPWTEIAINVNLRRFFSRPPS